MIIHCPECDATAEAAEPHGQPGRTRCAACGQDFFYARQGATWPVPKEEAVEPSAGDAGVVAAREEAREEAGTLAGWLREGPRDAGDAEDWRARGFCLVLDLALALQERHARGEPHLGLDPEVVAVFAGPDGVRAGLPVGEGGGRALAEVPESGWLRAKDMTPAADVHALGALLGEVIEKSGGDGHTLAALADGATERDPGRRPPDVFRFLAEWQRLLLGEGRPDRCPHCDAALPESPGRACGHCEGTLDDHLVVCSHCRGWMRRDQPRCSDCGHVRGMIDWATERRRAALRLEEAASPADTLPWLHLLARDPANPHRHEDAAKCGRLRQRLESAAGAAARARQAEGRGDWREALAAWEKAVATGGTAGEAGQALEGARRRVGELEVAGRQVAEARVRVDAAARRLGELAQAIGEARERGRVADARALRDQLHALAPQAAEVAATDAWIASTESERQALRLASRAARRTGEFARARQCLEQLAATGEDAASVEAELQDLGECEAAVADHLAQAEALAASGRLREAVGHLQAVLRDHCPDDESHKTRVRELEGAIKAAAEKEAAERAEAERVEAARLAAEKAERERAEKEAEARRLAAQAAAAKAAAEREARAEVERIEAERREAERAAAAKAAADGSISGGAMPGRRIEDPAPARPAARVAWASPGTGGGRPEVRATPGSPAYRSEEPAAEESGGGMGRMARWAALVLLPVFALVIWLNVRGGGGETAVAEAPPDVASPEVLPPAVSPPNGSPPTAAEVAPFPEREVERFLDEWFAGWKSGEAALPGKLAARVVWNGRELPRNEVPAAMRRTTGGEGADFQRSMKRHLVFDDDRKAVVSFLLRSERRDGVLSFVRSSWVDLMLEWERPGWQGRPAITSWTENDVREIPPARHEDADAVVAAFLDRYYRRLELGVGDADFATMLAPEVSWFGTRRTARQVLEVDQDYSQTWPTRTYRPGRAVLDWSADGRSLKTLTWLDFITENRVLRIEGRVHSELHLSVDDRGALRITSAGTADRQPSTLTWNERHQEELVRILLRNYFQAADEGRDQRDYYLPRVRFFTHGERDRDFIRGEQLRERESFSGIRYQLIGEPALAGLGSATVTADVRFEWRGRSKSGEIVGGPRRNRIELVFRQNNRYQPRISAIEHIAP